MQKIIEKLKSLKFNKTLTRIKHLRGRHDQLDHAWNRGMGGGGAGGAATGGLSKMMKYRQTRAALLDMVRTGDMTRNEAREQLRAMRETLGDMSPTRREEFAAGRATGGLAGITQSNVMMNQTKRIPPKVKTGRVSSFAPMPIDASELKEGGKIYEYIVNNPEFRKKAFARKISKDMAIEKAIYSKKDSFYNTVVQAASQKIQNALFKIRNDFIIDKDFLFATNSLKISEMYSDVDWVQKDLQTLNEFQEIKNNINKKTNDAADRMGPHFYMDLKMSNGVLEKSIIIPDDESANTKMFEILNAGFENNKDILYFMAADVKKATELKNQIATIKAVMKIDNKLVSEERENQLNLLQLELDEVNKSINDTKSFFQKSYETVGQKNGYTKDDWNNAFYRFKNILIDGTLMEYNTPALVDEAKREFSERILFGITTSSKDVDDITNYYKNIFDDNNNNIFIKSLIKGDKGVIDSAFHMKGSDFVIQELNDFMQTMEGLTQSIENFSNTVNNTNALNYLEKSDFNENIKKIIDEYKKMKTELSETAVSSAMQSVEQQNPESMNPNEIIKYFFENETNARVQVRNQREVAHIQQALGFLYDMQSFNGDVTVTDWGDIINPSGSVQTDKNGNPLVMWRSVKGFNMFDPTSTDRGLEYVEQMRTGETHYPGAGVSGFGTYMKTGNIYGENTSMEVISDTKEYIDVTRRRVQAAKTSIQQLFNALKDSPEGFDVMNEFKKESLVDTIFADLDNYLNVMQDVYDLDKESTSTIGDARQAVNRKYGQTVSYESRLKRLMEGDFQKLFDMYISPDMGSESGYLKNLFNQVLNDVNVLSKGFKPYDRQEGLSQNAQATRNMYGEYTVGYTVNKDANMPYTFVNEYNSGNTNHFATNSLDNEIDNEFSERYPMLDATKINLGIKMTMLGYDAYYAHINDFSTNIIVLNRAILNMPSTTLGPQTTERDIKNLIATGQPPASAQR